MGLAYCCDMTKAEMEFQRDLAMKRAFDTEFGKRSGCGSSYPISRYLTWSESKHICKTEFAYVSSNEIGYVGGRFLDLAFARRSEVVVISSPHSLGTRDTLLGIAGSSNRTSTKPRFHSENGTSCIKKKILNILSCSISSQVSESRDF
jgi:hypothetical protein